VDGARANDEVDIRFVDLDIESSQDCTKDLLQIRDISTSVSSRLLVSIDSINGFMTKARLILRLCVLLYTKRARAKEH